MRTIKTKVVAIVMAVAMVFALGMTSMAATKTYDDISVGDTLNEGDKIRNNHSHDLIITVSQDGSSTQVTVKDGKTYTIPAGVTAYVNDKYSSGSGKNKKYNLSITLTAIPPTPPTPSTTVDYDDLSEGSTLNGGDTIINNHDYHSVSVDINDGEDTATISTGGGTYTIPDGMTATVTGKSASGWTYTLAITLTAAPSGGASGESLTPEQLRALSINAFVENMYEKILGRAYDIDGRSTYVSALNDNSMTGSDVVRAMLNSSEFAAMNLSDADFVATLYQVIGPRTASAAEVANWTTALANGATRAQVANAFLATEEFANVCAYYKVNV